MVTTAKRTHQRWQPPSRPTPKPSSVSFILYTGLTQRSSREKMAVWLLPAVACQPATCGGNRKDLRASHTHGRTHDPIRQPYAHTRRVSHILSIQQHMCTFLQLGPTMRVFTFLNTVDTMHKTRASDRTHSTSRASHAFFRARIVDRRPIWQHSCCLQRSLGCCIPFTASSPRRTWWSFPAVQCGLSFIYTPQ